MGDKGRRCYPPALASLQQRSALRACCSWPSVVAVADRGQILSGTGNCAALQGAGDGGRRNAQVGGGLPWRDAGRQCAGQLGPLPSRAAWCLRRLSRGRLAQPATELAPVRLAAVAGQARTVSCCRARFRSNAGNPQGVGHLALRYARRQRPGHQFQRRLCSPWLWCDFARASPLQVSAGCGLAFRVDVREGAALGTPSCFPLPLAAGRGVGVGIGIPSGEALALGVFSRS